MQSFQVAAEKNHLPFTEDWKQFGFSPKIKRIAEAVLTLNQVEMFELLKLLQLRFDIPDSALMGGGQVVVQAVTMPIFSIPPLQIFFFSSGIHLTLALLLGSNGCN